MADFPKGNPPRQSTGAHEGNEDSVLDGLPVGVGRNYFAEKPVGGALRPGGVQGSLNAYRRWYVEPLFDYLGEALEDGNVVLATLVRYKHKVEWYRRTEVLGLYQSDTTRGEAQLKRHMFEFLFDEGLSFQVEPTSASGEPDSRVAGVRTALHRRRQGFQRREPRAHKEGFSSGAS